MTREHAAEIVAKFFEVSLGTSARKMSEKSAMFFFFFFIIVDVRDSRDRFALVSAKIVPAMNKKIGDFIGWVLQLYICVMDWLCACRGVKSGCAYLESSGNILGQEQSMTFP